MKTKLTSRKFWAAVVGVIMGIALAFGVDGDTITNVAGAVMSLTSIVTYIYTEGKVDAASVEQAVNYVIETVDSTTTTETSE